MNTIVLQTMQRSDRQPAPDAPNTWRARLKSMPGETFLASLLDPIQSPTPRRVRAIGLLMAIGHPTFYLLWQHWFPQPYEDLSVRLVIAGLGVVLMMTPALWRGPDSPTAMAVTSLIFWLTLPVFFTWMYLCNLSSTVWFASAAAMLLIYLHLTDWRLGLVGLVTGLPAGWLLFEWVGTPMPPLPDRWLEAHAVVFGFCAATGLTLSMSSANLRREQLKQAMDTMGIMAHELRTPLVTMSLIGEAIRQELHHGGPVMPEKIEHLAHRLLALVRHMHRQIDTQITNARLLRLPKATERVSAACILQEAVSAHPYRHPGEQACVEVRVLSDFEFHTVRSLFLQVIDNLLRNALRALATLPQAPRPGDLCIVVEHAAPRRGFIRVIDRGPGIPPHLIARLFQPFVSSHHASGHGLGLAFCQRVVHRSGGHLTAESPPGAGATFTIDIPLAPALKRRTSRLATDSVPP
jgi:two-component system CAI-1 autoinducer sensor kinase/phosphatase CqsS